MTASSSRSQADIRARHQSGWNFARGADQLTMRVTVATVFLFVGLMVCGIL